MLYPRCAQVPHPFTIAKGPPRAKGYSTVTPDRFEILAVRELRKVGFDLGQVRVHRRSELAEPESGFVLELVVSVRRPGTTWARRALVVCRKQLRAVERDVIESVKSRLADAQADAALVFVTTDFSAEAIAAAEETGIALLRVVDGRSAYNTGDHYPAWLPAHLAQLVDRDAAGQPRARLLEAGLLETIVAHLERAISNERK